MIAVTLDEPFCYYLVSLEGVHMPEPIWFEYTEVELVAPSLDQAADPGLPDQSTQDLADH